MRTRGLEAQRMKRRLSRKSMVEHYNFCSADIIATTNDKKLATIAPNAQVILFTAKQKE